MTNWNEIRLEWEASKITLNTLAEKYDVKLGTLKSRKSREGWPRDGPEKGMQPNRLRLQPTKRMQPAKKGGIRIASIDLSGAFTFASADVLEIDLETGFAPIDQSAGGTLGGTYDPNENIELPF